MKLLLGLGGLGVLGLVWIWWAARRRARAPQVVGPETVQLYTEQENRRGFNPDARRWDWHEVEW